MLTETESHLYLYNFAPILQLWAGICLLFFYEKLLLANNPFEKSKQKCVKKIYDAYGRIRRMAMTRFQSYFIDSETDEIKIPPQLQPLKNPNSDKKLDKYWMGFRRYVYNTAIVSFFYAVIVMCVAAAEKYDYLVVNNYYKVLLITNSMVVLHFLIISITYKSRFSQCVWTHVCFLLSVFAYIHIHMWLRNYVYMEYDIKPWCSIGNGTVVIWTLASCLIGMIFILVNISLARIHTWIKSRAANRIDRKFTHMLELPVSWETFKRYHPLVFLSVINKISKNINRLNADEGSMKILANRIISFVLLLVFCNDSEDDVSKKGTKNKSFGSYHNSIYKMTDKITVNKMIESMEILRKTYYRFVEIEQVETEETEAGTDDSDNAVEEDCPTIVCPHCNEAIKISMVE